MNSAADYRVIDLTIADVDELVAAFIVPEFCFPVNNFYTLIFSGSGFLYCAECYQVELYEFACPAQRRRFIDNTRIDDHVIENILADEVIDVITEFGGFCCKCETWAVVVCADAEGSFDAPFVIQSLVNYIKDQMDLYRGPQPAVP
jgi:hypothetical protein